MKLSKKSFLNCQIKCSFEIITKIVPKISSTHYTTMVNKIKDTSPPSDSQPFFSSFFPSRHPSCTKSTRRSVLVHSIFHEIPPVFLRCPLSLAKSIHSTLSFSREFDLACVRSLDDRLSDSFLLGVRTIG